MNKRLVLSVLTLFLVGMLMVEGVWSFTSSDWNSFNLGQGYTTTESVTSAYNFIANITGSGGLCGGTFTASNSCVAKPGYSNIPCCDLSCSNPTSVVWSKACALSGKTGYYFDLDGDSYGNNSMVVYSASYISGIASSKYVTNNNDCDDNNANVKPSAVENCFNSIDDDCDNLINEGCTNINTTYWADMNGQNISNSSLGDTVLMVYGGYQLTDKIINYTVQEYNSSFVWWNPFRWFSKDWNGANKISGNANEPWVITNQNPKRFNATIIGTSVWNVSKNLTINNENNSRPIINLVNPVDGIYVAVNSSTRFNQTSNDEDDLLKITWDFGDGKNATFYNYSSYINSSSANVEHNYTSPGIYYWTLSAQEMNRNQKDSKTGTIYVLDSGVNVMPVISSPHRGQASGTGWLTFNASKTFVANCSTGQMSNRNFTTSDGLLNCSYLHAPQSLPNNYYLTFNWDFGNEDTRTANWTNNDSYANVVFFHYKYDIGGRHDINLNVEYGLE